MSNNENEKLRYTVLLVPNNEGRVKQFRISFDIIIFMLIIFAMISFLVTVLVVKTSDTLYRKDNEIASLKDGVLLRDQENIVKDARIEELENELRETKSALDAAINVKEKVRKKNAEAVIPSALPVAKATSLPEYQDEEGKQYIQFLVEKGTKIYATADGRVKSLRPDEDYGYFLRLEHGNGYESEYILKCKPRVSEGDKVSKGSTLFKVNLDVTTLSYRVYLNGEVINPLDLIKVDG